MSKVFKQERSRITLWISRFSSKVIKKRFQVGDHSQQICGAMVIPSSGQMQNLKVHMPSEALLVFYCCPVNYCDVCGLKKTISIFWPIVL